LIRAARYLGVAPWELIDRPLAWQEMALAAESAESKAQATLQERAAKKAKKK
jgi:hypothetical protein